ncbi:MAG: NHLP bacteriocin export ABC transporter permease/ATPase subunit [Leptolyngbyaceae cyanobacterium]
MHTPVKHSALIDRTYQVQGNQAITLDNPQMVWLVESGSMALFAIPMQQGITAGSRRYLLTLEAGQAMFASPTDAASVELVAVAIADAKLIQVPLDQFREALWANDPQAIGLLEDWIEQLGAALAEQVSPTPPQPLEGLTYFALSPGDVFQPTQNKPIWVQIQTGCANFMAYEELPLTPAHDILPLSSTLWLQMASPVEFAVLERAEIANPDRWLDGLFQLQVYVLSAIACLEQQQQSTDYHRFHSLQKLNQQVMHDTLGDLASLLHPTSEQESQLKTALDPDQALLVAAGAIGRYLGIPIFPPARSENLSRVIDPVEAIARASRLRSRRITLQGEWWKKDCGALLAYTHDRQPVALLPDANHHYDLLNPQQHQRTPLTPNLAAKLAPAAYMFYRPLPDKVLKTADLLKFALRGQMKEVSIVLLAGVATTLLGMITPQAMAILIDQAIPDANRHLLMQIALGLCATALGGNLFQLAQSFAVMRLETFADASTQAAIWDRLLSLKPGFFRQYAIGDLNSRVSAVTQIRQKLSGTILRTMFSSLFSLLNLGLLFYYNGALAAIAFVVALMNIAVTVVSGVLTLKKAQPLMELQGQLLGIMVQLVDGVTKLRVAGAESRAFAYWGKHYQRQIKLMLSTQGIEDCLTVINKILPALTTGILFWFAAGLLHPSEAQAAGLSTGTFLAFNAAFGTFIGGATSLSGTVVDVLQIVPLWNRAKPILEAKPEVDSTKTDPGRLSGRLVVDHVIFRYRNDGPLTLDDVSLRAEPGEFIALVGASGSGKSTLFRLLLGFDTPESGSIYYDGQDLSGLDTHAVRRQLGVVLQNSRVMSASIFENIASGAQITMDEAWEAARMAGFAEDIESMPMGMHTVVSEGGTNLSGGQRQRLLIARSLVLKPKILLFDEATSALDNRTQAIVSQSLEQLKVTRIAIAHRLSTIRNADRIYVFQAGCIVQQGTFAELANREGLFAQLIARQTL